MAKHTYGESKYSIFFMPLFHERPDYPKNVKKILNFKNYIMQYELTWESPNDTKIDSYTVFCCQDTNPFEFIPICDV